MKVNKFWVLSFVCLSPLSSCMRRDDSRTKEGAQNKCNALDVKVTESIIPGAPTKKLRPDWIKADCTVDDRVAKQQLDASVSSGRTSKSFLRELAKQGCALVITPLTGHAVEPRCDVAILKSVCVSHYDAAELVSSNILGKLFSPENISNASIAVGDSNQKNVEEEAASFFIGAFRGATAGCLGALAAKELSAIALKSAPELRKTTIARFLTGYGSSLKSTSSASFKQLVAKKLAFAACAATARVIADKIDITHPSTYDNACGPRTSAEQSARLASCLRTSASLCEAANQVVDFGTIYEAYDPGGSRPFITNQALTTLGAAASITCALGGTASGTACGMISQAANEIAEALRTGNNSWGDCVGTSRAGACAGASFASWLSGITPESVDAPIIPTGYVDGVPYSYCCHCQRNFYQNNFFADTKFRRDSMMIGRTTYVNAGVDQSLCKSNETKRIDIPQTRNGESVYYSYSACEAVMLVGESTCTFEGSTDYRKKITGDKVVKYFSTYGDTQSGFGGDRIHIKTEECLDDLCEFP